jgi:hypothetical protein
LSIALLLSGTAGLDCELGRKDVAELSTESIPTACNFLLVVIVVARSKQVAYTQISAQKLTKDHFRNVAVELLVDLNGDSPSVVPDTYEVFCLVDVNFDHVHPWVSDEVVCCVHKNLI